jgi:hypothetical protein
MKVLLGASHSGANAVVVRARELRTRAVRRICDRERAIRPSARVARPNRPKPPADALLHLHLHAPNPVRHGQYGTVHGDGLSDVEERVVVSDTARDELTLCGTGFEIERHRRRRRRTRCAWMSYFLLRSQATKVGRCGRSLGRARGRTREHATRMRFFRRHDGVCLRVVEVWGAKFSSPPATCPFAGGTELTYPTGSAKRLAKRRRLALWPELTDFDIIAREVSGYRSRFEAIEKRLDEVEKVNARLEDAALTTRPAGDFRSLERGL